MSAHLPILASHNRAGEITYKWISGNTYEVKVVTYTKDSSPADRCELQISWGDGDMDTIYRANGLLDADCGPLVGIGEMIPGKDIRINIYIGYHTFPGPGTYKISMMDPNRNEKVTNMQDSFNTPFFLELTFMIGGASTGLDTNSSPELLTPPIDDACSEKIFIHNAGAFDVNGDSISYVLGDCLEEVNSNGVGVPALGYYIPADISINPLTGDLVWDTPPPVSAINAARGYDEYNICFEIIEWRSGAIISRILRDMQITVVDCENEPPLIFAGDTCVLAGDTVIINVVATDPDSSVLTLSASGGPMVVQNSAVFTSIDAIPPATGLFSWETNCSNIRKQSYFVTFKAEDNDPEVSLVSMETSEISVIAPAPLNPMAIANGNAIDLSWDPSVCTEALGYKIYRRNGSFTGVIDCPCETGVPASAGYSLISTVNDINNTIFKDENNGSGLIHGIDYCYRIIAYFIDGAESCASEETCAQLIRDVPIITHVSVGQTDNIAGVDTVIWSKPKVIDTITEFTGPYHYKIYGSDDFTNASTFIGSTNVSSFLELTDTVFIHTGLNTEDLPHSYKIVLYSDNDSVGCTHLASSVFLDITPNDNQLQLSWQENVPWTNTTYYIYKYNSLASTFDLLDSTSLGNYTDTGLVNGKEFCYYIKSKGGYTVADIVYPIINYSQIKCETPIDLTSPCAPTLVVNADCDDIINLLTWTNPNYTCADDVASYNIYFTPVLEGELKFLQSVAPASLTSLAIDNLTSLAGCYAITAVDSFQNESILSDSICVDNCPEYTLPNVFSPDGNLINDNFVPFPYKFIEAIDLKIFDRWGQLVFETTDPDINWDGKYYANKQDVSEGVFFYVCYVDMIRLKGPETKVLTGFVHILRGNSLINK